MYFPYTRAKQYDLAALVELKSDVFSSKPIIPIVEPVAAIKKNQYKKLLERNIPFVLVVNPIVGDLKSLTPHNDIITLLVNDVFKGYDNLTLGYIIQPQTTLAQVRSFISSYSKHGHAFIHFYQFPEPKELARMIAADKKTNYDIFIDGRVGLEYVNTFSVSDAPDIIVKDGFVKQPKNELYPAQDFFSDLHKIYNSAMGYQGFGDFTIIGSQFDSGGGPAYVVALHLTESDTDKNLVVNHFKSDASNPPSAVDPGGKFRQALSRLKKFVDSSSLKSEGVNEYLELYRAGHYPGLGVAKKISIKHHIETVAKLL